MEKREASGLRPILEAESGNRAKGAIIGHEHRVVLDRMGRDEQVECAERFSAPFEFRADRGVSARGRARSKAEPRSPLESSSTAMRSFLASGRLATPKRSSASVTTERQRRSGVSAAKRATARGCPFNNALAVLVSSMKRVTTSHPARGSRSRARLLALGRVQEIIRGFAFRERGEKAIKGMRLGRQDHVAGHRIAADVDLLAIEAKGRRQTHSLAASVLE